MEDVLHFMSDDRGKRYHHGNDLHSKTLESNSNRPRLSMSTFKFIKPPVNQHSGAARYSTPCVEHGCISYQKKRGIASHIRLNDCKILVSRF